MTFPFPFFYPLYRPLVLAKFHIYFNKEIYLNAQSAKTRIRINHNRHSRGAKKRKKNF